jgi:hypothetical protein
MVDREQGQCRESYSSGSGRPEPPRATSDLERTRWRAARSKLTPQCFATCSPLRIQTQLTLLAHPTRDSKRSSCSPSVIALTLPLRETSSPKQECCPGVDFQSGLFRRLRLPRRSVTIVDRESRIAAVAGESRSTGSCGALSWKGPFDPTPSSPPTRAAAGPAGPCEGEVFARLSEARRLDPLAILAS